MALESFGPSSHQVRLYHIELEAAHQPGCQTWHQTATSPDHPTWATSGMSHRLLSVACMETLTFYDFVHFFYIYLLTVSQLII